MHACQWYVHFDMKIKYMDAIIWHTNFHMEPYCSFLTLEAAISKAISIKIKMA